MKMLVYTTGPSCRFCRMTRTLLDQAEAEYETADLREIPETADRFRDMGHAEAPVVEVYKDGDLVDRWSGLRPSKVEEWVRRG